jgi:hypothetical protein
MSSPSSWVTRTRDAVLAANTSRGSAALDAQAIVGPCTGDFDADAVEPVGTALLKPGTSLDVLGVEAPPNMDGNVLGDPEG